MYILPRSLTITKCLSVCTVEFIHFLLFRPNVSKAVKSWKKNYCIFFRSFTYYNEMPCRLCGIIYSLGQHKYMTPILLFSLVSSQCKKLKKKEMKCIFSLSLTTNEKALPFDCLYLLTWTYTNILHTSYFFVLRFETIKSW